MRDDIRGLTEAEVQISRAAHGSNMLAQKKQSGFFGKLRKNLGDPIIKILIAAFFVTLLFSGGSCYEVIGIAASIIISVTVSTLSEYGSEKAFRKMQKEASAHRCEVMRGGKTAVISVDELVVGDTVCIKAGDKVGADGILIDGTVCCNMAALNGESEDVRKTAVDGTTAVGTPSDGFTVLRGSLVTAGKGIMLVKAVGEQTYYGKIAGEIQDGSGESPLREKLTVLAKTLSKFGYFCAVLVALAYLVNATAFNPQFVFSPKNIALELLHAITLAVSVVVVAVPEGLPMMITVVLSSNMIRMQRQNIRVRKPVGIETAGNIDILFTDKTGTLTYGEPKVISYYSGSGVRSKRSADMYPLERYLLGLGAFYSGDSKVEADIAACKKRAVSGDVTDRAFLNEYLEHSEMPQHSERIAYLPFDSKIKLAGATVHIFDGSPHRKALGSTVTLIKGAPELLIKHCKSYYTRDGRKERLNQGELLEQINTLSSKGIRTLALITTSADAELVKKTADSLTNGTPQVSDALLENACFVALLAIRDELRAEAPRAVKTLKKAGVQTVMVTGDAKATALAIAKEAGIVEGAFYETVLESSELREMPDEQVISLLPTLRVVARALPDDKSRLVRLAKNAGRITAMTGDGLNDAPALKSADVGFAMGSGTEVAKEAGDIIITNNDISSIEKAVLYGRTIFRSIRKFVVFQLIMNLSAVCISIIGPFIGVENPVTVVQMLWINLIMDTLAAIAFAGEAPLPRYMKEPPVPKSEPVLNGDMITRIFVMGVFSVTVSLYYLLSPSIAALFLGRESLTFMSGFFALFVFCGIFGAFYARSGRVNIFAGLFANSVFVTVIALVFTAQIGMIYAGGEALRCTPLSIEQLKTVMLLAVTVIPYGIFIEAVMKFVPKEPRLKIKEKRLLR